MTRALVAACSCVLVLAAASGASVSVVPGGNLIQNPGAESVTSSGTPAGWTLDGSFTAAAYGNDLPKAESTRIDGGTYYFFGGHGAGGHARQTIDVSSSASEIDSEAVQVTLSAFIGGYQGQGDPGTVAAVFRNGAGANLKTVTIGPVTPADRDNVSKLLSRSATPVVPSGTRSIEIILTGTRESGGDADSYFDNISLTLEKEKEAPSTAPAKYRSTGGQLKLFEGMNGGTVSNGGTPPRFSTKGHAYCLRSISTYHWNNGQGKTPGRIGLGVVQGLGGAGKTLGPWKTTGSAGNGGAQNVLWTATFAAGKPVVINGTYTCRDSDPASWSQNQASGGHGMCTVYVTNAVRAG